MQIEVNFLLDRCAFNEFVPVSEGSGFGCLLGIAKGIGIPNKSRGLVNGSEGTRVRTSATGQWST